MVVLWFFLGCQDELKITKEYDSPWMPPDEWGIYDVGLSTFTFTDVRGKELRVDVWYPGLVPPNKRLASYEPLTLTLNAYRDIPSAKSKAPLIAFSHGFFAIRFQSAFLMEYLASHGYVVLAPDHPDNTILDFDDDETVQVILERPDDVRASVDEFYRRTLLEDDDYFQMIGSDEYAVMGHSFGSHTAMVLGGAKLDYAGFLIYCGEFPDSRPCGYLNSLDPSMADMHGASDERVVATVPMSPGLWYTFGQDGAGLDSLRRPLVLAGDLDTVLDYGSEALPTFDGMSGPKTLATFHGAGHYGFSDICLLAAELTSECGAMEDGSFADIDVVKSKTRTLVTAFMGLTLQGDDEYKQWLFQEYWSDDIVELQTIE